MTIKRYGRVGSAMIGDSPFAEGPYVKFKDHQSEIADLNKQIESMRCYQDAFYKMASALNIGARAESPMQVFEEVMLPAIEGLNKRLEAAELNAARYEWLKSSDWYVGESGFYCDEGGGMNDYENHIDNLDSAIDAARLAQGESN